MWNIWWLLRRSKPELLPRPSRGWRRRFQSWTERAWPGPWRSRTSCHLSGYLFYRKRHGRACIISPANARQCGMCTQRGFARQRPSIQSTWNGKVETENLIRNMNLTWDRYGPIFRIWQLAAIWSAPEQSPMLQINLPLLGWFAHLDIASISILEKRNWNKRTPNESQIQRSLLPT